MELGTAGLQEQPFRTHSRPLVVVSYAAQQHATQFLDSVYNNPHGLGIFRGPTLSGKTTILRYFAEARSDDAAVAIVDGTSLNTTSFLEATLAQFGYDLALDSVNESLNMLKVFLQQQTASRSDHAPLLIIENTHAMNPSALNILCDLAKLKVRHQSALRLILSTDRCISSIIDSPAMEYMSSRLTDTFELGPLTPDETVDYLHAKLRAGGCFDPENVLPDTVCDELHIASGGWPGVLDRLVLLAMARAPHCPVEVEHIEHPSLPDSIPAAVPSNGNGAEPLAENGPATLYITKDGKTLKEVVLDGTRMMIGRSEHNDLCINSKFISRHHALFVRQGAATFLMDLNSTNGTYVNSRRISNQALIHEDVISVGNHGMKFIDPGACDRSAIEGVGFADTAVMRTLRDVRRMLAKENTHTLPAVELSELAELTDLTGLDRD